MKKWFAIPLVVLVLGLGLRDIGTLLAFRQNQGMIVEQFCENQDRPAMKCNGACYLRKQMAAEDDGEATPRVPSSYEPETVVWAVAEPICQWDEFSVKLFRYPNDNIRWRSLPSGCDVFRPPEASPV